MRRLIALVLAGLEPASAGLDWLSGDPIEVDR